MEWITIIGLFAAVTTTTSLFPQMVKSWRTKKTTDLSLPMCVLLTAGIMIWLVYGFLISDLPILAANSVSLVAVATTLLLKIKYG